jgi:hypothetical protein
MNVAMTESNNPATQRAVRRMTAMLSALAISLLACTPAETSDMPEASSANSSYPAAAQVLEAVKAAEQLHTLPDAVAAALSKRDDGGAKNCFDRLETHNPTTADHFGECAYGDQHGTKLMVMYGDSRAWMFSAPLEQIAAKNGWKLRVYGFGGCSVADLQFMSDETNTPNKECDTFRSAAIPQIQALHPNLVITTSGGDYRLPDGSLPTPTQLQEAWVSTFRKLAQAGTQQATMENIPAWPNNDARCLAAHVKDVQACSFAAAELPASNNREAQRAAGTAAGVVYVPTVPWVCADRCEPVIADKLVYRNEYHFSRTYALYLTGALSEALQPAMA